MLRARPLVLLKPFKVRSYSLVEEPVTVEVSREYYDKCCFGSVLMSVFPRLTVKMWNHISKALGGEDEAKYLGALGIGFMDYVNALWTLQAEVKDQLDPIDVDEPRMLELIHDLWARGRMTRRQEDLKLLYGVMKNGICGGERALFGAQPNFRQLQEDARTLVINLETLGRYREGRFRPMSGPSCIRFNDDTIDIVPRGTTDEERLRICDEIIARAKVAANAGGFPEYAYGGLVDLFNFQLPHTQGIYKHHRAKLLSLQASQEESAAYPSAMDKIDWQEFDRCVAGWSWSPPFAEFPDLKKRIDAEIWNNDWGYDYEKEK